MNNLKLKSRSIAITLTILSVALTGCMGAGEGTEVPEQPDNIRELSEWGVYYTASISDLPDCTDEHSGKLYFIGNDAGFVVCVGGVWDEISLTGEQGLQGPAGADGADGADGQDGADGAQGPAGADGADGADGQDGADGAQGPAGADGADGADGAQGPAGADGADGTNGADGSMPVVMEMTVTVSSFKYFIDGIQQGTVTLYRGFTYNFDLSSVPSSHPFKIGTSANGNQYTSGVTTIGNIMSFTVPSDAPNTLYYYCQNHSNMGGSITINSLGSVS
ncbi:MAG: hypothetical protein ACJZ4N_01345 [Candidatus Thalassarchaeaceae archaeon]